MSSRSLICWVALPLLAPITGWSASARVSADTEALQEVIVTAGFRSAAAQDTPVSVTVLTEQTIQDAGQQHFQDLLGLVPNLNWAGGSSRPRYFQLRGIGEREQYEGAPNPSVGFLIDDIDFSGMGMVATLFDVKQIEVLRGPQGTRYGANALAGLIAVRTQDPVAAWQTRVTAELGSEHAASLGAVLNAPLTRLDSALRLSLQRYTSDGFMHNAYLGRGDTNDRDETTARLKWRWQPSEDTQVDATLLHADVNNGYDAWAIDNSRTTLADHPGKDTQRANGGSLRVTTLLEPVTLTVVAANLHDHSINSFDADWGNDQSWGAFVYDYFMSSLRERHNHSFELRLASQPASADRLSWLVGAYTLRMHESGRDDLWGRYADPGNLVYLDRDALVSDYRAQNAALFAEVEGYLASTWRTTLGARFERRRADYVDRNEVTLAAHDLSATNSMWGGQWSLQHDLTGNAQSYLTLSRGYKAGGFNLGGSIDAARRYFKPESLVNVEWGIKAAWLERRVRVDADVFYSQRRDLQMRTGVQADPTNPGTYVFITTNAARGYNAGLEAQLQYLPSAHWELGGSLGLLRTRVSGALDADGNAVPAREQAHAPEYTAAMFATWRSARGVMARVDVQAKDNFYFDVPTDHNQQSHAYSVTNLKLGYEHKAWQIYGWVNNVFDRDYAVRGFYFSNEPPTWDPKRYTQLGDPRTWGVRVQWQFQ